MVTTIRRGFTLIELLIVISIILILASLGLIVARPIWTFADRAECANNMRQIGTELVQLATESGRFPSGGDHPGAWGSDARVYRQVNRRIPSEVMTCPASDSSQPTHPQFSACSYIYLGNLAPTYVCECSECIDDEGDEGSPIWTIHWSGVDYADGHERSGDYTSPDLSGLRLADNLRFNPAESERSNPSHPIVPDDLQMNRDRSRRALRQTPYWAHDESSVPLLADIVVLTEKPAGSSWEDAHTKITEANRYQITFYANHVPGSANSKTSWGAHVLFASGSVVWRDWDELRFQLRVPTSARYGGDGNGEDHYYFF